jgi:hypothetical protein
MDTNTLEELLQSEQDFIMIDSILINYSIPKEITNIIYDYIKPCEMCKSCCKACYYYCQDRCLRVVPLSLEKRDVCCRYEFNRIIEKYKKITSKKD